MFQNVPPHNSIRNEKNTFERKKNILKVFEEKYAKVQLSSWWGVVAVFGKYILINNKCCIFCLLFYSIVFSSLTIKLKLAKNSNQGQDRCNRVQKLVATSRITFGLLRLFSLELKCFLKTHSSAFLHVLVLSWLSCLHFEVCGLKICMLKSEVELFVRNYANKL